MRIGLAPLTVGRPSPSVLVDAAEAAGFGHVGVTLQAPGGDLSGLCFDRRARYSLRRRLDDAGIAALDVGVVVLGPSPVAEQVDRLAETGADLGARCVLVMNADDDTARAAEAFGMVCERAAAAGLRALVEFMPYSSTRTLQEAQTLVATAVQHRPGIVLDVLHLFRSGGTIAEMSRLAPDAIGLVQLCDARTIAPPADRRRAEALGDREYPGRGELPLRALLRTLPGAAPLTVEAPVARDAERSPLERARIAARCTRQVLRDVGYGADGDRLPPVTS